MLTTVEARNRQGDLLVMPLEDDSSGLRISDIEGLDPVKATIVSSSFANQDGEEEQSARRDPRNLKIQIELVPDPEVNPNQTVRSLRQQVYKFFMTKTRVNLRFVMDDGLEVEINGRVETCTSAMFTREPAVDVVVFCGKPDFLELAPELVEGSTTSGDTPMTIDYAGSVETGIQFVLSVDRPLDSFSIFHTPIGGEQIQTLDFDNVPLEAGDVLTIDTSRGPSKGATLVRAGVTSSVLRGVSPQSKWIELMPGDNDIRVYAEGAAVPFVIQYTNRYGGL